MCKKILSLLMVVIMLLFLMTGCGGSTTNPSGSQSGTSSRGDKYGGDLVIVTDQVSNTMDAHYSLGLVANHQWLQNIYETAIILGADGKFYPMVCDYDYSDDGLTLKLTVRDRRFSNGQKVKIEDVVASFERGGKISGSFAKKVTNDIKDIKIDGNTATFTFSRMTVAMMTEIADLRGPGGFIMPKEICDKYGTDEITDPKDVIGTGPYMLKTYNPDHEIVLVRNDKYDKVETEGTGPAAPRMAYVDSITYAVNTDEASRTAGMISGKYHIGGILSSMKPYAEQIGLKRNLLENQWTDAIFFNLSEANANSPVQDVNFRKAVRAALDMKAIMLSIFNGDATRFELDPSPMTKYNKTYYNTIIKDAEWNIADKELAKKYLAQSNYKGEEIKWLVSADSPYYRAAMAAIPKLEDIGIKIKLWTVDAGSHGGLRKNLSSGYQIGGWETQKGISSPYESLGFIVPSSEGLWKNAKRDELLETLLTTTTGSDKSVKAYKDMCKLITEEVPWIGFGTEITVLYTQSNVEINYAGTISYYWNTYLTKK